MKIPSLIFSCFLVYGFLFTFSVHAQNKDSVEEACLRELGGELGELVQSAQNDYAQFSLPSSSVAEREILNHLIAYTEAESLGLFRNLNPTEKESIEKILSAWKKGELSFGLQLELPRLSQLEDWIKTSTLLRRLLDQSLSELILKLKNTPSLKRFAELRKVLETLPRLSFSEFVAFLEVFQDSEEQARVYQLLKRRVVLGLSVYRFEVAYTYLSQLPLSLKTQLIRDQAFTVSRDHFESALKRAPKTVLKFLSEITQKPELNGLLGLKNFSIWLTELPFQKWSDQDRWTAEIAIEFLPFLKLKADRVLFLENLIDKNAVEEISKLKEKLAQVEQDPDHDPAQLSFSEFLEILSREKARKNGIQNQARLIDEYLTYHVRTKNTQYLSIRVQDMAELLKFLSELEGQKFSARVRDQILSDFIKTRILDIRPAEFEALKPLFSDQEVQKQVQEAYLKLWQEKASQGPTSTKVGGNGDLSSSEYLSIIAQYKGTPVWNKKIKECYERCVIEKEKYFMEAIRLASASTDPSLATWIVRDLAQKNKWNVRPDLVLKTVEEFASSQEIFRVVLSAYIETHENHPQENLTQKLKPLRSRLK